MITVILAAGYGTRLYPLTLDKPKALLKVGGRSILDRLVENIKRIKGNNRIYIVTNDKFYKNFDEWAKTTPNSEAAEIINDQTKSDETRIGAIGDINFVLEKRGIKEDLLITGSDNLFDLDLREFTRFGLKKRPFSSVALFDVKDKGLAHKYGICLLDENSQVIDFEEKPKSPKSTQAAIALYFIPKKKIAKVFDYMKTDLTKDAPGNLIKWLAKEDKVFGYVFSGVWYDIGDMESLKKADREFSRKER